MGFYFPLIHANFAPVVSDIPLAEDACFFKGVDGSTATTNFGDIDVDLCTK